MTQEPISATTSKEYVSENWWHRLLKVLLIYLPTVVVFGFLALLHWDMARYYTYSYSFEKDYSKKDGAEARCYVYEYSKSLICGGLQNPKDFMDKYKASQQPVNVEFNPETRKFFDFETTKLIIEGDNIRYKAHSHYNYRQLILGLGYTVAIGLIVLLVGLSIYKLILYIAYGHTRVKKLTT